MDIDCRLKPCADIIFFYFQCTCCSHGFQQFRIPGTCQHRRTRPCGSVHTTLRLNAQAICRHNRRYTILRDISVTIHIGHTGIRLTTQELRQLLVGQLCHKFFHGKSAVCHLNKLPFTLIHSPRHMMVAEFHQWSKSLDGPHILTFHYIGIRIYRLAQR